MRRLREILKSIKLQHLLLIPWNIHALTYLDFFNTRVPPRFSTIVKGKPDEYDMEFVSASFELSMEGHGFFSQKDSLFENYFVQNMVVSHGYKISQCNDHELMMLFYFLIPIFHPRKPTYIPLKWANTIIAL
jgi:hypothetical protein